MHTIALSLHIIGAGLMLGVVFFSLVIAFRKTFDPTRLGIFKTIRTFGTVAAIWQILTGLYLYFGEAEEFRESRIFWFKMGLFVLDGILAVLIIGRQIKRAEAQQKGELNLSQLPYWGLVSLVIIITVIVLGVFLTEG
ncbi:MAG TPA: hypothetical protein VJK26_00525 [Patescibacteria group bacterium]|nr:hypothetical protein [Patescibacteria group bacterium]